MLLVTISISYLIGKFLTLLIGFNAERVGMRCLICNLTFAFDKGKGVSYRNKPICDECLMSLMMVCLDKYKEGIKRYLKQEVKLEHYAE